MQEKLHGGNIALLYLIFRDHISALPGQRCDGAGVAGLLMQLFLSC